MGRGARPPKIEELSTGAVYQVDKIHMEYFFTTKHVPLSSNGRAVFSEAETNASHWIIKSWELIDILSNGPSYLPDLVDHVRQSVQSHCKPIGVICSGTIDGTQ